MAVSVRIVTQQNRIPLIIEKFPLAVDATLRKFAYDIQKDAMDRISWYKQTQNKLWQTGAMHANISTSKNGEWSWIVSEGQDYGIYQEFGTKTIPARPYMRWAVEKEWQPFQEAFRVLMAQVLA